MSDVNRDNTSESADSSARPAASSRADETIVSLSDTGPRFSDADEMPAGYRIGKYEIKRLLGRGGMGSVYLAVDIVLRREIALKVLPQEFTSDEQALKRFVREAQLAARLQHPNAVTVFDVGRKNGTYFIAMELVRGSSGEQLLKADGPLPPAEATRIAADCCRALVAAHTAGLIHRDIKPANILRAEDGVVKLTDFGLAKLHASSAVTMTDKNVVLGTPHYMSPEQCNNEPLDGRSDLYSLGATYYALLTAQRPFDGGTTIQVLFAHCTRPIPDPRAIRRDVPSACTAVIRKAMAKSPGERYADASQMLADLDAILAGQSPTVAGASSPAASSSSAATGDDMVMGALLDSLAPASAAATDAPPLPPMASSRKDGVPMGVWWAAGGAVAAAVVIVVLVMMAGGGDAAPPTSQPVAIAPMGTSPSATLTSPSTDTPAGVTKSPTIIDPGTVSRSSDFAVKLADPKLQTPNSATSPAPASSDSPPPAPSPAPQPPPVSTNDGNNPSRPARHGAAEQIERLRSDLAATHPGTPEFGHAISNLMQLEQELRSSDNPVDHALADTARQVLDDSRPDADQRPRNVAPSGPADANTPDDNGDVDAPDAVLSDAAVDLIVRRYDRIKLVLQHAAESNDPSRINGPLQNLIHLEHQLHHASHPRLQKIADEARALIKQYARDNDPSDRDGRRPGPPPPNGNGPGNGPPPRRP